MPYPDALRSLLGLLPVAVKIDGFGRDLLLRVLDPAFHGSDSGGQSVAVQLDGWTLQLDLDQPNQRLLQYAFRNVLATYDRFVETPGRTCGVM